MCVGVICCCKGPFASIIKSVEMDAEEVSRKAQVTKKSNSTVFSNSIFKRGGLCGRSPPSCFKDMYFAAIFLRKNSFCDTVPS